jgi:glutamine amidotransferase
VGPIQDNPDLRIAGRIADMESRRPGIPSPDMVASFTNDDAPPVRVAIVDYGMGNLHSVKRKLDRIGVRAQVTAEPSELVRADKLLLPGVGHFGKAMEHLVQLGLVPALREAVLVRKTPILGICLGMQLFARRSEEGGAEGLGWIDADVTRFGIADTRRFKVPQMGWNGVRVARSSPLLEGVTEQTEFYFVHAYHMICRDSKDVLCDTDYGYAFASVVQRENIYGVQFHPEKSHDAGESLLRNFLHL